MNTRKQSQGWFNRRSELWIMGIKQASIIWRYTVVMWPAWQCQRCTCCYLPIKVVPVYLLRWTFVPVNLFFHFWKKKSIFTPNCNIRYIPAPHRKLPGQSVLWWGCRSLCTKEFLQLYSEILNYAVYPSFQSKLVPARNSIFTRI